MSKIAIIGPHGTCKTTICHQLYGYFGQLREGSHIVEETAREAKLLGLPINEESTLEAQEAILLLLKAHTLAGVHRIQTGEIKHIITDRCYVDNVTYPITTHGERAAARLYDMAMRFMDETRYDYILRTPLWNVDEEIVPDGVRSTKKSFQIAIDKSLDSLLIKTGTLNTVIPAEIFRMNRYDQTIALMKFFDNVFGIETPAKWK